ncbi:fibronectin type III domain-containing protein [Pedobacter puniceum]|uniref:T9SS type A sorting domain-containing protein n=1 Tax=Pedobacter puniceum TaxID=2666136 RepID=A0A7K0FJ72_9SPHI|nr:fibronectin type III domain-containing protein [Pedobacter puniceum]MRX46024.1 T9SS type A sorting domain-containing protein [Pedobacter puniceum]
MKKNLLSFGFMKLMLFCFLITFSAKSFAQIGTGWGTAVSLDQQVQLENYSNPSGDNTDFTWPRTSAYIDAQGNPETSDNSDVTSKYNYNSSTGVSTFTLKKYPGNRSELRVFDVNSSTRNYTSGTRQFEGYITVGDKMFDNAIFQLFGGEDNATMLQIRSNSYDMDAADSKFRIFYDPNCFNVEGNRDLEFNVVNRKIKLNVIHIQQTSSTPGKVYILIDDELKFSFSEEITTANYFKYGIYGRENDPETNGITNAAVVWEDVRIWKGGTFDPNASSTPPAAPSNLTATAVSSSQINLSWTDNSNNETKFYVQQSNDGGTTWFGIGNPAANATSLSVTALNANTSYSFRVRSEIDASRKSAYSNTATATTTGAVPNAPSNLTATAASASSITLSWQDNSSNETKFYVQRSSDNGATWVGLGNPAANATSFTATGLSANTPYWFRVRSEIDANSKSPYSNTATATTQIAYYRFRLKANTNLALQSNDATITTSENVNVGTYSSSSQTQQFQIVPTDNGFVRIIPRLESSFALSSLDGAANDGDNAELDPYASYNRQQWKLVPIAGSDAHKVELRLASAYALDCADVTPVNGSNVQIWIYNTANTNLRQQWVIEPANGGAAIMAAKESSRLNLLQVEESQAQHLSLALKNQEVVFSIPQDGFTTVKVYNINGQLLNSLVGKSLTKGEHKINFDSSKLKGLYLIRLTSGNHVKTIKVLF